MAGARAAGSPPGKQVAVLEPAAYRGQKDVSAAWAAGVLEVGHGRVEAWEERVAIMMADGGLQREEAERLVGGGYQTPDPQQQGHTSAQMRHCAESATDGWCARGHVYAAVRHPQGLHATPCQHARGALMCGDL